MYYYCCDDETKQIRSNQNVISGIIAEQKSKHDLTTAFFFVMNVFVEIGNFILKTQFWRCFARCVHLKRFMETC